MKRVAAIVVVVPVALGACGTGTGGPAPAVEGAARREVPVTRGSLTERVLLTGQLRAASAIELIVPKTEVWQLTIRWMAEDGARVRAGDRVLEFDNSSFTNGLREKELQLLEAESTARSQADLAAIKVATKEYEVAQHRVALEKATLMAGVPADLLARRTAQERALEQARAQAAVERVERELVAERRAAALETKVKQLELEKARRDIQAAKRTIDELVLKAPRDGVILVGTHPWQHRRFQIGDMVQPGFTILSLPDLEKPMQVAAELSDVDDGRIAVGAKGTCTLDAFPDEPIGCTVVELAPVARAVQRQSLRRAFAVKLAVDERAAGHGDPERTIPGMSVKVELAGPTVKDALLVPRGALVIHDGEARLRLAGGDLREVEVAACDAQRCALASGATEGELVVEGAP